METNLYFDVALRVISILSGVAFLFYLAKIFIQDLKTKEIKESDLQAVFFFFILFASGVIGFSLLFVIFPIIGIFYIHRLCGEYLKTRDFLLSIILIMTSLLLNKNFFGDNDMTRDLLYGILAFYSFIGLQGTLTKGKAMGDGDTLLALTFGGFLGFIGGVLAVLEGGLITYVMGSLVGVFVLLLNKIRKKKELAIIPFGPFIIAGLVIETFLILFLGGNWLKNFF